MNIKLRVDQEIGKIKKELDILELINKKHPCHGIKMFYKGH